MTEYQDFERRLFELETRVANLEGGVAPVHAAMPIPEIHQDAVSIIRLVVTNKKYQPEDHNRNLYQDNIWFDCEFSAVGLTRTARAVKGALEFCDLFGEPKFLIGYTLNEPISPGGLVSAPGIGFEYNQFMSDHQWMLGSSLKDMKVQFRVVQILYDDGTLDNIA
jgi:hypothetical protein